MNIRVIQEGSGYRFTVRGKDQWTPSTFFPQLDSTLAHIKTAVSEKPQARILFDLVSVDSVDSSLITIIVQTVRMAGAGRVSVLVANPDVYSWLALLADLFDSEEEWRTRQKNQQP